MANVARWLKTTAKRSIAGIINLRIEIFNGGAWESRSALVAKSSNEVIEACRIAVVIRPRQSVADIRPGRNAWQGK